MLYSVRFAPSFSALYAAEPSPASVIVKYADLNSASRSGALVLRGHRAVNVSSPMLSMNDSGSAGLTGTQDAVRADMRGLSVSFQAMAYTLFGLGRGPTLVAATTEYLYHEPARAGVAMVTVAVPASLIAVLLLATCLRPFRAIQVTLDEERSARL